MKDLKVLNKHTIRPEYNDLPVHFLGNTIEEAEEVYTEYASLLNSIAYTYSISTGLDKGDLFADGLLGLAKAKKDFDGDRGDFMVYAIFRIKDALNENIRKYASTIVIPSYLKKASLLFERLHTILEGDADVETMLTILETGETVDTIPPEICNVCEEMLENLNNYADRAGITYKELVLRVQLLPAEMTVEDFDPADECTNIEDSILVNELMDNMTEEERVIARGIMEDRSYEDIADEFGKTKQWVSLKVKEMKERLSIMVED